MLEHYVTNSSSVHGGDNSDLDSGVDQKDELSFIWVLTLLSTMYGSCQDWYCYGHRKLVHTVGQGSSDLGFEI